MPILKDIQVKSSSDHVYSHRMNSDWLGHVAGSNPGHRPAQTGSQYYQAKQLLLVDCSIAYHARTLITPS
jgi:hypothetical protein